MIISQTVSSFTAYIGPGVGVGIFVVIGGILTSIFMAIIGVFWYPIKRLIKKLRSRKP